MDEARQDEGQEQATAPVDPAEARRQKQREALAKGRAVRIANAAARRAALPPPDPEATRARRRAAALKNLEKGTALRSARAEQRQAEIRANLARHDAVGLTVQSLETTGVHVEADALDTFTDGIDTWAIPRNPDVSYRDMMDVNPFPMKHRHPEMHYEMRHQSEVQAELQDPMGFRVVSRREAGVTPLEGSKDYGVGVTDAYQVADTVLMKIPKRLAERRRAATQDFIAERRTAIQPVTRSGEDLTAAARRRGLRTESEHSTSTELVD